MEFTKLWKLKLTSRILGSENAFISLEALGSFPLNKVQIAPAFKSDLTGDRNTDIY